MLFFESVYMLVQKKNKWLSAEFYMQKTSIDPSSKKRTQLLEWGTELTNKNRKKRTGSIIKNSNNSDEYV
jgi:hypothetical protein